jgi:hypothetical protein
MKKAQAKKRTRRESTDSTSFKLTSTHHPILYEINTRVLVAELSTAAGKKVALDSVPDELLDEWAEYGFDAVWLMGVWTTGETGLRIAREHEQLREVYRAVLPDCTEEDVVGSPYAVKAYSVSRTLGGKQALLSLRKRLEKRGMALVLDFVCNHTARDHGWVTKYPEYYIQGHDGEDGEKPDLFFRTGTSQGEKVVAFGRDPLFPGWTDTAQLNHFHSGMRGALVDELVNISALCDGVRCDMAMLVLSDVFERTWADRQRPDEADRAGGEFWTDAIQAVRARRPSFLFIAEAYWDLEWRLQQLGFDYTYDKRLYDRLLREGAGSVYEHLKADPVYQRKSVRFLENHDEPRAAASLSSEPWHMAAALVMSTVPGMVLIHEGQLEGRKVKIPVQLGRRPHEVPSTVLSSFYRELLTCLQHPTFRSGEWRLLEPRPAWSENHSWQNILAFWWRGKQGDRCIVVNYAPYSGQCFVPLMVEHFHTHSLEFRDLLGNATYTRERNALASKGIYFDLPPYGIHLFEVVPKQ